MIAWRNAICAAIRVPACLPNSRISISTASMSSGRISSPDLAKYIGSKRRIFCERISNWKRQSEIVAHMNEDHADANQLYASVLLGRDGEGWEMTGCDPEGCDLRLGGEVARIEYDARVRNANETRKALVSLVKHARQSEGG